MPVDLSLMKTFVLIYQTRSVTKTAEKLSVTQPSVSHALSRLRKQFKDVLFVRSAEGLRATNAAEQLYPALHEALSLIEDTVAGVSGFDPLTSERTFHLAATDLGEISLLPTVLALLEKRAPRISVEIIPLDFAKAERDLRKGGLDAVLCTPRMSGKDLRRDSLFSETYVGLCAASHPRLGAMPTMAEFLNERQIEISATSGHTEADRSLRDQGIRKNVALKVAHFAALPRLLERTDYVAMVPSTLVDWCMCSANVSEFTLPFDTPQVEIALYTHHRSLPSPAINWFRKTVQEALKGYSQA